MLIKRLLTSVILFLWLSCASTDNSEAPIEEIKGPVSGTVNLFASNGLIEDHEGMAVELIGTEYSTITDANGFYNFVSVPFGNHLLKYTKQDFGTHYKMVEHDKGFNKNGTQIFTLSLGKVSKTAIYETIPKLDNEDLLIRIVTNPIGSSINPVYISIFFGLEVTVSNTENIAVKSPITFFSGNTANIVTITKEQLSEMGFKTGDHVFFKVYGDSFHTNAYESESGTVHPNVRGPGSSTMSVILP